MVTLHLKSVIFGCFLSAQVVSAQADCDYLRSRGSAQDVHVSGLNEEAVGVEANFGSSSSSFQWKSFSSTNPFSVSAALPLHRLGKVICVGTRQFIVSGKEITNFATLASRGVICAVECGFSGTTPVVAIVSTVTLTAIDPGEVIWDGNYLLVVDHKSRSILGAGWTGWSGSSPSLPIESAFSAVANISAMNILAKPWSLRMSLVSPGKTLISSEESPSSCWNVSHSTSGWNATSNSDIAGPIAIRNPRSVNALGAVEAWVDADLCSGSLTLKDSSGTILQTYSLGTGSWASFTLPAQVYEAPGDVYSLGHSPASVLTYIHPSVRYGAPYSASGFTLGNVSMPISCYVGQSRYGHGLPVESTVSGTVQGSLWVAFRNPGPPIDDPVSLAGPYAALDPIATFEFSIPASAIESSLGLLFPIPDNSELEGLVVFWQYVFLLPGDVIAFSEVFGDQIQASGSSILSGGNQGNPKGKEKKGQRSGILGSKSMAAAYRWVGATPEGKLSPQVRDRVERLRAKVITSMRK